MHLIKIIWCGWCVLFLFNGFGQDSSRVLNPVSVFSRLDSIPRIAIISSSIPHFELTISKMDELGATDVGEALKYIPGVQLRDYGGIGGIKTVSFRSLGAAHTAVQVDGSQIPAVQSGVVNLSSFELFGLEKVAFTSGQVLSESAPASAYLQTNSIALQSVLVSRPEKMRLGIYSNTTTINAYEKGLYFQHRIGERFFAGLQGMTRFGNGVYHFVHPELPEGDLIKRENAQLFNYRLRFVGGYVGKRTDVTLSAFYNNNEQELPGAAVLFNPSNDQKLWNEDWRFNLNHRFEKGKWSLSSQANYQSKFTRYFDPYFLNLQGFIDSRYLQQTASAGVMASRSFRFPKERIFVGTDLNYNNLEGSNFNSVPERFQQNVVLGGATILGRFRLDGNLATQLISDHTSKTESRSFAKVSPFLSVAYLPFEKKALRIRTFYKNAFRMPTFNDLYYNTIGNVDLEPEEANSFNLGLTYGVKRKKVLIEFTGDVFYNRVKNKIVAIPTKDLFNWSMQNIGETEIRGLDWGALITFNLKKIKINANTNHSYNTSLDITNPESANYGNQIPYTPYYTSSSSLSVEWRGYKISSNVLYSGFRYSLNENIYANYLPPFTDLNIGLAKQLKFGAANLLIDARVMNVLNKNYQVIRSYPMPGRYYQLRLKFTLEN